MSTVVYEVYDNAQQARQVVQRLLDAGLTSGEVFAFSQTMEPVEDTTYHDRNVERKGSFGDIDPAYHDRNVERQGSFGDIDPAYHDRNVERQGSFGDIDPAYHDRNVERQGSFGNMAPHGEEEDLVAHLTSTGIPANDAATCADRVRQGATVVVARAPENQVERVRAILHQTV